jgi:hypothetical protein
LVIFPTAETICDANMIAILINCVVGEFGVE